MPDEALDLWRSELQQREAAGSVGPPGRPRSRRRRPSGAGPVSAVLAWSAGAGAVLPFALMLIRGWPPPLIGPTPPTYAIGPLLCALVALGATRRLPTALLAASAAVVTGAVTLVITVSIWIVLDFLDCWMSWFSDC